MATLVKKPARVVGTISGNQPQVRVMALDADDDLYGGDFVKKESSTDADIARAASPIAADDLLVGLLLHDAKQAEPQWAGAGAANTYGGGTFGGTFMGAADLMGSIEGTGGHVALANADNIFQLTSDAALATTDIGELVGVVRDTSGSDANIWEVDEDSSTNSAVIVAIPNYPGVVIGTDVNAPVWIMFLAAASVWF